MIDAKVGDNEIALANRLIELGRQMDLLDPEEQDALGRTMEKILARGVREGANAVGAEELRVSLDTTMALISDRGDLPPLTPA